MRFDPARVLDLADSFSEPRLVNTPGETRAAERVAQEWERAGWKVERLPVRSRWGPLDLFPILMTGFLVGAFFEREIRNALPDLPVATRLALASVAVLSPGLVLFFRVRRRRREEKANPSENVVGVCQRDDERGARLVVIAGLPTFAAEGFELLLLGLITLMIFLNALAVVAGRYHWPIAPLTRNVAVAALIAQWFCTVALSRGLRIRPDPVVGGDRTALPFLCELARVWPTGARERLETVLIAYSHGGDLMKQLHRRVADGKPTLLLRIHAPGSGPVVEIAGRGMCCQLAVEAAESLWIPCKKQPGPADDRLVSRWPWQRGRAVMLSGNRADLPIDAGSLSRMADLVMEMALRWGKANL